jgi:hypothetical protein
MTFWSAVNPAAAGSAARAEGKSASDYNDLFNDANVVDGERRCFFAPPQTL